MRTPKILLATVVAAGAMTGAVAAPASAYVHEWSPFTSPAACNPAESDTRCNDNQGLIFNEWGSIRATALESAVYRICGRAVTRSNTVRSTTGGTAEGNYCASNSTEKLIDIAGTTPESQAYVFWNKSSGGGGSYTSLRGRANTEG